jgi:uncharacterized membrane protein YebE (DUF533 family)
MKFFVLIVIGLMIGMNSAEAQTTKRKVRKRQVTQTTRIAHGVNNGELTGKETKQLAARQRHIQNTKKAAKADGVVTRRERAQINRKQNRASANIARKKNNGASR